MSWLEKKRAQVTDYCVAHKQCDDNQGAEFFMHWNHQDKNTRRIKDFTPTEFLFSMSHTLFLKITKCFTPSCWTSKIMFFQGYLDTWAIKALIKKKPITLKRSQAGLLFLGWYKSVDGWWVGKHSYIK